MNMATLLKGKEVIDKLNEELLSRSDSLKEKGVTPTLGIVRLGERPDDMAYERGALKRAEKTGVSVKQFVFDADMTQDELIRQIDKINDDSEVHGVLMFRPLPSQIDDEAVRNELAPEKDVDGITDRSLSGVFTSTDKGFPSCTAQATMEMLHFYNIEIERKKAAIIGRSLVIGRPVAMMLMHENATVVNCHTRTDNIPEITREADILVVACGQLHFVGPEFTNPNQVIIDIGTDWDPEHEAISGDVDFDRVEPHVRAISPVPGGVGRITTCVLVSHVIEAARRYAKRQPLYAEATK